MARLHSGIVIGLVGLTLVLLYLLDRSGAPSSVLERARVLLGAMVVQGAIGYTQYFSHLPALLVGVHVFGVTVVWTAMLWFYDGLTHRAVAVSPVEGAAGGASERPAERPAERSSERSAEGATAGAVEGKTAGAATPVPR